MKRIILIALFCSVSSLFAQTSRQEAERILIQAEESTCFYETDMKGDYPIVAVVESYNGNFQEVLTYTNDGAYYCNETSKNDLFFVEEMLRKNGRF